MFLSPLRANSNKLRTSKVKSMPAPMGGWNARDGVASMDEKDAVELVNYVPMSGGVDLRGGSLRYWGNANNIADTDGVYHVANLITYSYGSTDAMLAFYDVYAFDASSGGFGAASSEFSLGDVQRVTGAMMGDKLVIVDGASTPKSWLPVTGDANLTITGVTSSTLNYVWSFKGRLFFIEENTLSAWYLGLQAIQGAASELDMSGFCSLGGALIAGTTWTRDGGNGADDLCVFLTDKGEVIIFEGSDPSDANLWAMVGVFKIGEPVGFKPMVSIGGDVLVLTTDGLIALSQLLPAGRVAAQSKAITDKINPALTDAINRYGSNYGWQVVYYPKGSLLVINVPLVAYGDGVDYRAEQYVLNTTTKAWCKFTGLRALCLAIYNENLYFGGRRTMIVQMDNGRKDDAMDEVLSYQNIEGDILPAFSYFGSPGYLKHFNMVQPIIATSGNLTLSLSMNTDFSTDKPAYSSTAGGGGTPWGSPWSSAWSRSSVIRKKWFNVSGIGNAGALRLRTSTQGYSISLKAINYLFNGDGVL